MPSGPVPDGVWPATRGSDLSLIPQALEYPRDRRIRTPGADGSLDLPVW